MAKQSKVFAVAWAVTEDGKRAKNASVASWNSSFESAWEDFTPNALKSYVGELAIVEMEPMALPRTVIACLKDDAGTVTFKQGSGYFHGASGMRAIMGAYAERE